MCDHGQRHPNMPNQLPKMIQARFLAFSIAHPGLGPRRVASSFAWAELVTAKQGNPTVKQTCRLARRSRRRAGRGRWQAACFLSDKDNELKGELTKTVDRLKARHIRIRAGRPQTNTNIEALHKTILEECWASASPAICSPSQRPALRARDLPALLQLRPLHHRCLTGGQIPADIIYGAP